MKEKNCNCKQDESELMTGIKLVTNFLQTLVNPDNKDSISITEESVEMMKEKLSSFIVNEDPERDFVLDNDALSFNDLLWLIDNGHVSNLLLGKRVAIHNPLCKNKYWVVIGVNHDGTKNTVDLRAEVASLDEEVKFNSENNKYKDSNISKVIKKLVEGFSQTVKDRLATMDIVTNGEIIKSKIKLLSMTELGLEDYSDYIEKGEGNPYPFLTHMMKNSNGNYVYWATRSRDTTDSTRVWFVACYGAVGYNVCGYMCSVVPTIRVS